MKLAVLGAGAGGAATAVDLAADGHEVILWSRSGETLRPFVEAGGIRFDGVSGAGLARVREMTTRLEVVRDGADAAIVVLPTFLHADLARALAACGWPPDRPVILNPGHTGGALEFAAAFGSDGRDVPPLCEFSTLTYVARKLVPDCVTVTGRAGKVRAAALPGGEVALELAGRLFSAVEGVADVLASGLANVNMVLHPPGAVLGAAWVEARGGDFTFYVDAMTPGVARVMRALDDERRAVARSFGHELPGLIEEMQRIGTVEADIADPQDFRAAISGGTANRTIRAPDRFSHRYYVEDFGHGLLPLIELGVIGEVETPVAHSLFALAEAMTGSDYRRHGRTSQAMGIAGLSKARLLQRVGRT